MFHSSKEQIYEDMDVAEVAGIPVVTGVVYVRDIAVAVEIANVSEIADTSEIATAAEIANTSEIATAAEIANTSGINKVANSSKEELVQPRVSLASGLNVLRDWVPRVRFALMSSIGCVFRQFQHQTASVFAANASGALFAIALLLLSFCWLKNSPSAISATLSIVSILSAITMNTVEWEMFSSPSSVVHMQAMVLVSVCYFLFFIQWGYVAWEAIEISQRDMGNVSCSTNEGWYVVFMVCASSTLRFVEPALRDSGGCNRSRNRSVAPDYAFNIPAIILAAALAVSALLLQTFAVFGRLGNVKSWLALMPYFLTFPMLIVVNRAASNELNTCHVWKNFSHCSSVAVHGFCIIWPLLLYITEHMDKAQTMLTFAGNVCIMAACKLIICVVDPGQQYSLVENNERFSGMQLL
jgi:hypothetical protein